MSRVFEAIKRSNPEISDLALMPIIADPGITAESMAPEVSPSDTPGTASKLFSTEENGVAGQGLESFRRLSVRLPTPHPLLPFGDDGAFHAAEQYRILRTKIVQHPRSPRMLVVSSAGPGDGKSITAINLAGALALKSDATVLLIDADLRRSSIFSSLGLPPEPGLSQVLGGNTRIEDAIVAVEQLPNLHVLPAGSRLGNPTELLGAPGWGKLCSSVREMFRFIVIDSPPIGAVADFDLIQAPSDGVILVARPDHTKRDLCFKALKAVPKEKVLGVVLNCVPKWSLWGGAAATYGYYDRLTLVSGG